MAEFTIIDLVAQAEMIEQRVQGWSAADVVAWLSKFGRVETVRGQPELYIFQSSAGPQGAFWFTPDGHLAIVPRDH